MNTTSPFPPTTLAIDFGTKRIGLAISRASLAEPLRIIPHNAEMWETLKQICLEEEVEQIVVGVSEQAMAALSRSFANQLQAHIPLPITTVDETLSSHQATQDLRQRSAGSYKTSEPIDHYAAATFLQEWLDTEAN